jgi:hypothetical protein
MNHTVNHIPDYLTYSVWFLGLVTICPALVVCEIFGNQDSAIVVSMTFRDLMNLTSKTHR